MRSIGILVATFGLLVASGARASWFEFCDLEGTVQSVREHPKGTFELTVQVEKASRAKRLGEESYTDCHEHSGKLLDAAFTTSELPRTPVVGDNISFSRSVVDGFSEANGAYAGTSINTRLHSLRKQNAAVGR